MCPEHAYHNPIERNKILDTTSNQPLQFINYAYFIITIFDHFLNIDHWEKSLTNVWNGLYRILLLMYSVKKYTANLASYTQYEYDEWKIANIVHSIAQSTFDTSFWSSIARFYDFV